MVNSELDGIRGYKVERELGVGASRGWWVVFYIDAKEVRRARFSDADSADDAGVDFMFEEE